MNPRLHGEALLRAGYSLYDPISELIQALFTIN